MQPKITFDTGKDDQANRRFWRAHVAALTGANGAFPFKGPRKAPGKEEEILLQTLNI